MTLGFCGCFTSWKKNNTKLYIYMYMKSFIAKRVISILVNLRYLRFKLLKYKENNKKICNTFDHNFKNIPLYIMSNVSLERYYFVLYDGALTLKMSKMALNAFCDKTLHIYQGKKKKTYIIQWIHYCGIQINSCHNAQCIDCSYFYYRFWTPAKEKVMFTLSLIHTECVFIPQDSFGEFHTFFPDLQKVQEIIRKHHQTFIQLFWMTYCNAILHSGKLSLCT